MLKRRGGAKQRKKDDDVWNHHRDPERGCCGNGIMLMEKMGWEQGKGLGDGGGRVGKPWGQDGRMVQRVEAQESVQLTWQWKWTTTVEAKYWCEAAGVDYHQVIILIFMCLQTFHEESSQYLFFSSQVAGGGPMQQWHWLPFLVTVQKPVTTSYWEEARLFKRFVGLLYLASAQRFDGGRYWPK